MSRETEKLFKAFENYLEERQINITDEKEFDEIIHGFMDEYNRTLFQDGGKPDRMPSTSEDYLELAMDAETPEAALVYAKRAFMMDKNNLDAEAMVAELSIENGEALQKKYRALIKKAEKHLAARELWNDDCFGDYWGILQTRPYMRLRYRYVNLLIELGKYRKAILECQDMLRLCENDNMGVRYRLMHLYAFYEDEVSALQLYKKYHGQNETLFLLPLVALYYRLDDYVHARKYLKLLCSANPDTEAFFRSQDEEDDVIGEAMENVILSGYAAYGSADEFIFAMAENEYLYRTTSGLGQWICDHIK